MVFQVVSLEGDCKWYPDWKVCEYPQRPVGEGTLHAEASAVGNLMDGYGDSKKSFFLKLSLSLTSNSTSNGTGTGIRRRSRYFTTIDIKKTL